MSMFLVCICCLSGGYMMRVAQEIMKGGKHSENR